MIYVNFDKYGVLNHIEYNDEVIFKGNNNVNKVFVCFDGIELKPQHYLTYSALINDKDYSGNLTDLASVRTTYNGKDGYMFSIFSNLTKDAGTLKLSIRLVDRLTDSILVSGILPLIVQDSAVSTYGNVNITTTQYQALLTAFDELSQTFNETNFKTINEESLFGEGNITLPTIEDVDALDTSLKEYINDNITNLSYTDEELRNQINEQNKVIEKQDKRIKQLELASEGNTLLTNTEEDIAYEINATSDILPFAEINKIGGMTYKSDNLIMIDDLAETEKNGVKYRVENGVIYVNGTNTATSTTFINILLSKQIVANGTYSNNWFIEKLGGDTGYCRYEDTNGSLIFASDNPNKTQALNTTLKQIVIPVQANKTANLIIKPMLVLVSRNLCSSVKIGGINESQANDPTRFTFLFNNSPYLSVKEGEKYQVGIVGNTTKYSQVYIRFTDANKNVLSDSNITLYDNSLSNFQTLTIPTNCSYIYIHAYNGESAITLPTTAMVVKETTATAPTTWQVGFEGLRNSAVNEVVVKGANLQKTNWSGINSTIELSETLKAGQKYTICMYVNKDKVDCGINILEHNNGANNLLFNNSYTNWQQPQTGWVSFVITPIVDTNYLRINAYGITDQELQGAVLKGALVEEKKWVNVNLYKPYKEPTSYTIPTTITSIDGYGLGIDGTYHNYVDYERKVFTTMVNKVYLKDLTWVATYERNASTGKNHSRFRTFSISPKTIKNAPLLFSNKYKSASSGTLYNHDKDEIGCIEATNTLSIYDSQFIPDDAQSKDDMDLNGFIDSLGEAYVIYPLETPVETDLSYRITDDFIIEIEGNGTIIFDNEYKNDIPFNWTYQEKL